MKEAVHSERGDDFLAHRLVSPQRWVADHERSLCHVCTRNFGTFRRKHHCRLCGEIVCSNCTLFKNAVLPTIGYTRVRVCVSCIVSSTQLQKVLELSPHSTTPESPTLISEESHQWIATHVHSPLSKSDETDTESSYSNNTCTFDNNQSECSNGNNQIEHHLETGWDHPWPKPPVPHDEMERLSALKQLSVLDTPPEKAFEMICDLARTRLSCPMAAVSFMDQNHQWFKASIGLSQKMIPRKISFCAYTVYLKETLVVLDTLKDHRFEKNPLVIGAAQVRFCASAPIADPSSGHVVGSICVLDTRPRESCDTTILERLAYAASENLCDQLKDEEETPEMEELQENHLDSQWSARKSQPSPHHDSFSLKSSMTSSNIELDSASANKQLEALLMRLLTQNTETQRQLAMQQKTMYQTIGFHSQQINKLRCDFARMEAKIEGKIKSLSTTKAT